MPNLGLTKVDYIALVLFILYILVLGYYNPQDITTSLIFSCILFSLIIGFILYPMLKKKKPNIYDYYKED